MTCYFSKWVEAFPLQDKSAINVARAIYAAYCRHGAPNDIITDQGKEFVNQVYFVCNRLPKIVIDVIFVIIDI